MTRVCLWREERLDNTPPTKTCPEYNRAHQVASGGADESVVAVRTRNVFDAGFWFWFVEIVLWLAMVMR